MRAFNILLISLVIIAPINCQFWKYPQQFFNNLSWLRKGKTNNEHPIIEQSGSITNVDVDTTTARSVTDMFNALSTSASLTSKRALPTADQKNSSVFRTSKPKTVEYKVSPGENPIKITTNESRLLTDTTSKLDSTFLTTAILNAIRTSQTTEASSTLLYDAENVPAENTQEEVIGTTEEPRDNHRVQNFFLSKREKPHVKTASNISQNLLPLPAGAGAALVKPTKYHHYPHNQHIYILPECAIQQVCNAVYMRLNWTQPLCACPSRYRDPCSASLNADDQHTTELTTDHSYKALTLVKTCEPTNDMKACGNLREWSLLALQNIRTGKSHYLVICRCTETNILEGPMSHDQPTYASVPGIRVYGMMCVQGAGNRIIRPNIRTSRSSNDVPFPWHKVKDLVKTANWD